MRGLLTCLQGGQTCRRGPVGFRKSRGVVVVTEMGLGVREMDDCP